MEATVVLIPGGKRSARIDGGGPAPLEEVLAAAGIEARDGEKAEYAVNGEPTKDMSTPVPDGGTVVKSTVRPEGG